MKGTMTERSPGTWRRRVYIGHDPATGRPRQATRTFRGSKRQAQTGLAEFVAECCNGRLPVGGSITVSAYLDQWIDHIAGTRSPTTVRGYREKAKRINRKLGRLRLDKLTALTLDRTYREWLEEGLSPTTVHHLHGVISAALNQAVKWGIVSQAATTGTSPPPLRVKPRKTPTPDVIQQLISAADDKAQPVLAAAIALAATTGVRRGELLGLRWSDVDDDNAILHVHRTIKHDVGPGWVVGATKTHQERTIALDPFTLAVLKEHRSRVGLAAHHAMASWILTGTSSLSTPPGPSPCGRTHWARRSAGCAPLWVSPTYPFTRSASSALRCWSHPAATCVRSRAGSATRMLRPPCASTRTWSRDVIATPPTSSGS